MKPLAFIPARGGSKRLPRKALADLGGRPLIAWTIQAAQASGVFDDVVVCSEDYEILGVGAQLGATAVRRPDHLAADDVTLDAVLRWYNWDTPLYVLLPTSPFRTPQTIHAAWNTFQRAMYDRAGGLMSLVPMTPPEHALRVTEDRIEGGADFHTHRHHLALAYEHDGGHQIVTRGGGHIVPFFAPEAERLDINTPQDLDYARWILSKRRASPAVA